MKPFLKAVLVLVQVDERGNLDPIAQSLPVAFSENPLTMQKAFQAFKDCPHASFLADELLPSSDSLPEGNRKAFFARYKTRLEAFKAKSANSAPTQVLSSFSLDDIELSKD